jgi:hypothetical protein
MSHPVKELFENSAVKSVTISVLMAALGWAGNTLMQVPSTNVKLDEHTKQIAALSDAQSKTSDKLDRITDSLGRIEAKVDVANQKIDDDRKARGHK